MLSKQHVKKYISFILLSALRIKIFSGYSTMIITQAELCNEIILRSLKQKNTFKQRRMGYFKRQNKPGFSP